LCSSLGIEGFYIAVRGGVEDLSPPKAFFSPKGDKFVRSVLDLEPRRLALRFESFVVSGLGRLFFKVAALLFNPFFTMQLMALILLHNITPDH